ncbi:MAG: serine/threonine-protein phosphatase [Saprospiraceae bacterium]|nr:serine/threonine-protein phosphatase [Saprospiraceae bacterium]
MGTTLTVAWLISNELYVAWVGDSRAYLYNSNGIEKLLEPTYKYCTENLKILTDDHSLVWERVIQSKGKYSAEEARLALDSNVILRCLGHDFDFLPPQFIGPVDLRCGDQILLCSDGLNGMVSDNEIDQIFSEARTCSDLCQKFINAANNAGGKDNITLIVAEVMVSQITNLRPFSMETNKIKSNTNTNRVNVNSAKGKANYTWIFILSISNLLVIFGFLYFYLNKNNVLTSTSTVFKNDENKTLLIQDSIVNKSSTFSSAPRINIIKQDKATNDSIKGNNSPDSSRIDDASSTSIPPTSSSPSQPETLKSEPVTPNKPKVKEPIPSSKFLNNNVAIYEPKLAKCKVKESDQKIVDVERKKSGPKMLYSPLGKQVQFFACNETEIELDFGKYFLCDMTITYRLTHGQSNEIFIEQIILKKREWNKVKNQMKIN